MAILLGEALTLERCPHCDVDSPYLKRHNAFPTADHLNENKRTWSTYICRRCGGVVNAFADGENQNGPMVAYYPTVSPPPGSDEAIPESARKYLGQAHASRNRAPAGAVILAASAVDAMLKKKGYTDGSLYARIDKAATDHLITDGMAKWAHQVRLPANDQRHADEEADFPTAEDAQRSIDFAVALAEFIYVLPARVNRGIKQAGQGLRGGA
jgi:hypothetical protein